MAILVSLLAVVVALLAVLVAGLLRSHADILRSLRGLGAGGLIVSRPEARVESRAATDVAGVTPSGDAVSFAIAGAPHSTLLAFLTSSCATCAEFWTAFSNARGLRVPGGARLVVVTKGTEAESPARLRRLGSLEVPVVMSTEAWVAYDVSVAPYFAFVDGPGARVVGEGAAATWSQLADMLDQAISDAGITTKRGRRRRGRASGARNGRRGPDARIP